MNTIMLIFIAIFQALYFRSVVSSWWWRLHHLQHSTELNWRSEDDFHSGCNAISSSMTLQKKYCFFFVKSENMYIYSNIFSWKTNHILRQLLMLIHQNFYMNPSRNAVWLCNLRKVGSFFVCWFVWTKHSGFVHYLYVYVTKKRYPSTFYS